MGPPPVRFQAWSRPRSTRKSGAGHFQVGPTFDIRANTGQNQSSGRLGGGVGSRNGARKNPISASPRPSRPRVRWLVSAPRETVAGARWRRLRLPRCPRRGRRGWGCCTTSGCAHATPDGEDHPENPERLRAIWRKLDDEGVTSRCVLLKAKEAEDKYIASVHSQDHIKLMKEISSKNYSSRNKITRKFNSIYFNQGSSESAVLAAGSVIKVAEKVAAGELRSSIALVRPPGHHAERDKAMRFYLFNNMAVAANYLLNERPDLSIKKILMSIGMFTMEMLHRKCFMMILVYWSFQFTDLILETSILMRRMLLIVSLGKRLVKCITLMYPGSRGSVVMQIILLHGTTYCFQLPKLLVLI